MSKFWSEKSEMSELEFASNALCQHVAPVGSAQYIYQRIEIAARRLHWSESRTRDIWNADPRVDIKPRELRKIEEVTGLRYGRQELTEIDELIRRADALLDGPDEDFYRPFVAAFHAFIGALNRPGTEGD
jgi:hypothetical protein